MLKGKRVLVTGGNGFLGKYVVNQIKNNNPERIYIPQRDTYNLIEEESVNMLFKTFRPNIVVHLAAVVGGIKANKDNPGRFFYDNLMMGCHVIEKCRCYSVEKLEVIGTICSYPKFTSVPFKEESLWDGYPEETNAPYGIAKKALLTQCQAYREQYGLNAIYLMLVNLYGPGDDFDLKTSHVIPALIKKIVLAKQRNKLFVNCWGTGEVTREFLYVEDAAKGIVSALLNYNKGCPINIGTGQEIKIKDLVAKIVTIIGYKGKVNWDVDKPDGQPRRCLDVSKAYQEFGFKAETNFDKGLLKTIDWYGNHMPEYQNI